MADGLRYSFNATRVFRRELPDMDKKLLLKSQEPRAGSDDLGKYSGFLYEYFAGETRMDLEIRSYESAVVFSQVSSYTFQTLYLVHFSLQLLSPPPHPHSPTPKVIVLFW